MRIKNTPLLKSCLEKNRRAVLCTSPWPFCRRGPGRSGSGPHPSTPPLDTSGPAKEPPLYRWEWCLTGASLALPLQRNVDEHSQCTVSLQLCLFQMFSSCQKPGNTLLTAHMCFWRRVLINVPGLCKQPPKLAWFLGEEWFYYSKLDMTQAVPVIQLEVFVLILKLIKPFWACYLQLCI